MDAGGCPRGVLTVIGKLEGGQGQTAPFVSCMADNWLRDRVGRRATQVRLVFGATS